MSTPGRKTSGFSQDYSAGEVTVPFDIVGASDGSILTLSAGLHACEYAGFRQQSPWAIPLIRINLCGIVRIMPMASVPGFLGRIEVLCPVDCGDLGRSFLGISDASYTMALADLIWQRVVRLRDRYAWWRYF